METIDLKNSLAGDWRRTARRLKLIFWPIFVVAEVLFLAVQVIYVATNGISVLRFAINLLIFNIILVTLLGVCYVLIRRLLLRIYYYENKILTIEDISTDAVFTLDTELQFTSWGKGAERIFGYSEEEALSKSVEMIIPEKASDSDIDIFDTLLREGNIIQKRTIRKRKDGSLFPVEVSISMLMSPEGEPTGGLTVMRDITRQVQLEEELLRINAELKGYAHVVSHDLKGPLAAIKVAAQTLPALLKVSRTEETEEKVEQIMEVIDLYVEKSSSLIQELLTLAEAGQKPEVVTSVDVKGLVDEILAELDGEMKERGVTVTVDDDMGRVEANPTHMYQLFSNLIRNAIRHNESLEPRVEVVNRGGTGNSHCYLIRDNGPGIPPEDLERIFYPFYKGPRGDTGVGLSTVEKIVGVYDGRIKAYNDSGACFEITIMDFEQG